MASVPMTKEGSIGASIVAEYIMRREGKKRGVRDDEARWIVGNFEFSAGY